VEIVAILLILILVGFCLSRASKEVSVVGILVGLLIFSFSFLVFRHFIPVYSWVGIIVALILSVTTINIINAICEWFLIEIICIFSKDRREEVKTLREIKKREKEEAKKIQEELRQQENEKKEALKVEKKSIPKLPAKLDTNQITKDIDYLKTLDDKRYLVKYAGDFRDRFIAKGQTKTYNEIEKLVSAKTAVETALSGLLFAQEDRYTAQERAQAKYLLQTMEAQDSIKEHKELSDIKLDAKKSKLEADILEAKLKQEEAKKKLANLQASLETPRQKKTDFEKFEDFVGKQTFSQKITLATKKMNEEVEEAKRNGATEHQIEMIQAKWQQIIQKIR